MTSLGPSERSFTGEACLQALPHIRLSSVANSGRGPHTQTDHEGARQSCHPSDNALDTLQLPQNKLSAKP